MNNPSTTPRGVMSRASVAATISPEAMERVRQIDREKMTHGTHWVFGNDVIYTEPGLRLAVEGLRETHPADAAALQAEAGKRITATLPRIQINPAGVVLPPIEHNPDSLCIMKGAHPVAEATPSQRAAFAAAIKTHVSSNELPKPARYWWQDL
jgi:hypothetical protein